MADRHQKRLKRCVFIKLSAPHEQLTVTPVKIYLGVWVCGRRWVWERECFCVCVHLRSAVKRLNNLAVIFPPAAPDSVLLSLHIMYNSFFPPTQWHTWNQRGALTRALYILEGRYRDCQLSDKAKASVKSQDWLQSLVKALLILVNLFLLYKVWPSPHLCRIPQTVYVGRKITCRLCC